MESTALHTATVPGLGGVTVPRRWVELVSSASPPIVVDATGSPADVFAAVKDGAIVVLIGPWRYIDGVMRYLQRHEGALVDQCRFDHIDNRFARSQMYRAALRHAFAHVMVVIDGERIWRVTEPPDVSAVADWLDPQEPPLTESAFLLPVRRLQRVLTDIRRAAEGLYIRALDARITVLPFVYVPHDQSVVDLFADGLGLVEDARVFDLGTGTGVLALVAARAGASVVAADNSPYAVENARANVERLSMQDRIDVRGPADLFHAVGSERFDVVVFNAPWVYGRPETLYDAAVYDEDFRVITSFMRRVRDHLTTCGRVLLLYSSISELTGHGSMTLVRRLAEEAGLEIVSDRYVARTSRVLGARERVYLLEMRTGTGAAGGTAE